MHWIQGWHSDPAVPCCDSWIQQQSASIPSVEVFYCCKCIVVDWAIYDFCARDIGAYVILCIKPNCLIDVL